MELFECLLQGHACIISIDKTYFSYRTTETQLAPSKRYLQKIRREDTMAKNVTKKSKIIKRKQNSDKVETKYSNVFRLRKNLYNFTGVFCTTFLNILKINSKISRSKSTPESCNRYITLACNQNKKNFLKLIIFLFHSYFIV